MLEDGPIGRYLVDRTGHLFHFQDPDLLQLLRVELGISLHEHVRDAVVKIADVEVPYPFQYHIGGLPPGMAYDCLKGFFDCSRKNAGSPITYRSFGEWARDSFGDGIYRHFFRPYNNKLWATDIESMSCEWARDFVPSPDPEKVLRGAVSAHQGDRFGYNPTFFYPKEGGAGRIPKALAEKLPRGVIQTNARVKEVSTARRIVRLEDGREVNYRHLVVTAPMKKFVLEMALDVPPSVREASHRLRAQAVKYHVFAYAHGNHKDRRHWYYIPEEEYPFYRVGVLSNYADDLAPSSETLLCVEYGTDAGNESDERKGEQIREAVLGLRKLGIVRQDAELRHIISGRISPAYCIYDPERVPVVETIRREFQSRDIHFLGRFGLWYYNSAGQAIRAGFDLADALRPLLPTNRGMPDRSWIGESARNSI